MAFHLRDIIDLEFLLALDEETDQDPSARDRDIHNQIRDQGLNEAGLIREWLAFRKLIFFHETSPSELLPGTLFSSLMVWMIRGFSGAGLALGLMAAYSFLAYHGTSPINVTVFFTLFTLVPLLLSCLSLVLMARQAWGSGRTSSLFQALITGFFIKWLGQLFEKAKTLPGGKTLAALQDFSALMARVHKAHHQVLFWSFFILSSLFALGFCCGALGATLFRVAVTDLAFGWQSTLLTSGAQVRELVSWIALPWSWIRPDLVPGTAAIEGSRIILKDGITGLANAHLTAWWPFLAMGLLVYGVLFRLWVAALAFRGQASALARLDTDQPRFRRLLVRMQAPNLDTRVRETAGTLAKNRPPLPRPDIDPGTREVANAGALTGIPVPRSGAPETVCPLALVSATACPETQRQAMIELLNARFGVAVREIQGIGFDLDQDRQRLETAASGQTLVMVIQEVWQPPIRGLLHYYAELKARVFPHCPLWIVLTQTPGQEDPGVRTDDVNFQVWKKAVEQLNVPELYLERIRP